MNIDLYIEELILLGFTPGDQQRITEVIQNELTRLLSENDLPPTFEKDGEIPRLDGGLFVLRTGERPESIGARIGQAVYQGIAGSQSKESRSWKSVAGRAIDR